MPTTDPDPRRRTVDKRRPCGGLSIAAALALLIGGAPGCKPSTPAVPVEPPRLAAEEGCPQGRVSPTRLPVPEAPPAAPARYRFPALVGWTDATGFHPATHICDVADRIVITAADQGVDGGVRHVGGTVRSLPRTALAPPIPTLAIEPGSRGCTEGAITCSWQTRSPAMPELETVRIQRVPTGGWIHGAEELCRALPDDTIATCSTASRLAYVEVGCPTEADAAVPLQLGLHDGSLERRYDLDVEVPVARLDGQVEVATATELVYRFAAAGEPRGGPRSATLRIDLATPSAELELDGVREPCLAFGLHRTAR